MKSEVIVANSFDSLHYSPNRQNLIVTLPGFTISTQRRLSWRTLRVRQSSGRKQEGQFSYFLFIPCWDWTHTEGNIHWEQLVRRMPKTHGSIPYPLPSEPLDSLGFVHWHDVKNDSKASVISWPPQSHAEVASEAHLHSRDVWSVPCRLKNALWGAKVSLKPALFILTV